jgi:hypothetical protein
LRSLFDDVWNKRVYKYRKTHCELVVIPPEYDWTIAASQLSNSITGGSGAAFSLIHSLKFDQSGNYLLTSEQGYYTQPDGHKFNGGISKIYNIPETGIIDFNTFDYGAAYVAPSPSTQTFMSHGALTNSLSVSVGGGGAIAHKLYIHVFNTPGDFTTYTQYILNCPYFATTYYMGSSSVTAIDDTIIYAPHTQYADSTDYTSIANYVYFIDKDDVAGLGTQLSDANVPHKLSLPSGYQTTANHNQVFDIQMNMNDPVVLIDPSNKNRLAIRVCKFNETGNDKNRVLVYEIGNYGDTWNYMEIGPFTMTSSNWTSVTFANNKVIFTDNGYLNIATISSFGNYTMQTITFANPFTKTVSSFTGNYIAVADVNAGSTNYIHLYHQDSTGDFSETPTVIDVYNPTIGSSRLITKIQIKDNKILLARCLLSNGPTNYIQVVTA